MSLFPRFAQDLNPLFRILDEYNNVASHARQETSDSPSARSFQPRFDIKERKDSYVLMGEFPGLKQNDIKIEWSDSNTLIVTGHDDHRSEFSSDHHQSKQATVEDAETNVSKKEVGALAKEKPEGRWWICERSTGEFYRCFSFPSRVDHDGVKASLKDGVLTIAVPKASAPKSKKIEIDHQS